MIRDEESTEHSNRFEMNSQREFARWRQSLPALQPALSNALVTNRMVSVTDFEDKLMD